MRTTLATLLAAALLASLAPAASAGLDVATLAPADAGVLPEPGTLVPPLDAAAPPSDPEGIDARACDGANACDAASGAAARIEATGLLPPLPSPPSVDPALGEPQSATRTAAGASLDQVEQDVAPDRPAYEDAPPSPPQDERKATEDARDAPPQEGARHEPRTDPPPPVRATAAQPVHVQPVGLVKVVKVAAIALLGLVALLGGYSRIHTKEALLRHPVRKRIAELAKETPGLTIAQLASAVGLSVPGTRHHVRWLVASNLVRLQRDGKAHCVYPPQAKRAPLPAPREGQRLLRALLEERPEGCTRFDAHAALAHLPLRSRNYAIQRLLRIGEARIGTNADGAEVLTLTRSARARAQ